MPLFAGRRENPTQERELLRPEERPETPRNLHLHFHHANIALGLIVREGGRKVCEKAKHVGAVFLKSPHQPVSSAPLSLPGQLVVASEHEMVREPFVRDRVILVAQLGQELSRQARFALLAGLVPQR